MTRAMVLQSNQNCTAQWLRHCCTKSCRTLSPMIACMVCCSVATLVGESEGQEMRRLSTVTLWACTVLQHSGRVHRPSLFQGVQWPDRASTLYLPERRRAWHEAFSTSRGELPHKLNIGWQVVSHQSSGAGTNMLNWKECKKGLVKMFLLLKLAESSSDSLYSIIVRSLCVLWHFPIYCFTMFFSKPPDKQQTKWLNESHVQIYLWITKINSA